MEKILSIIIVSFNSGRILEKCLRSIFASDLDRSTYEVVVVDNASTDSTVAMVHTMFPEIVLLENKLNLGFAAANNQAMLIAKGKYILLLNPDTEVAPDALRLMLEGIQQYPRAGAVGPRLVSPDGTYQFVSARKLPTPFLTIFRLLGLDRMSPGRVAYFSAFQDATSNGEVEAISGACTLVPREILETVGLLDDTLPMGGEDIDWYRRILDHDYKIYYLAKPQVVHIGGTSRVLDVVRTDIEAFKAHYSYLAKHFGTHAALIYRFLLGITMVFRALFWTGCAAVRPASPLKFIEKTRASLKLFLWSLSFWQTR
ncbi:MAG: glycosyltransferase family 2 protein [Candidatus Hodarchaeota archaeon]